MRYYCILVCMAIFSFVSCSKDYNIQLPVNKPQLVVECYLEDGQPLRALISESADLLDTSIVPPVLVLATVVITHRNIKDTLVPFIFVDTLRRRAYNYGSSKIMQADYASNEPYRIDVYDVKGRHAYGVTKFIKPVPVESITPIFNTEQRAYCLTKFRDDPATANYFRLLLHKNAVYDSLELDILMDNSFSNSNNEFVYGSGYNFITGDVIYARLYHLPFEYYQYLTTLENARTTLINPFAISGEVVSNIRGGLGVFTALSFTQTSVIVP